MSRPGGRRTVDIARGAGASTRRGAWGTRSPARAPRRGVSRPHSIFHRLARAALRPALVFLLLLLPACAGAQVFTDAPPREDWYRCPLLRLTAFQTAQSDCMLLECGGESMMVDGGSAPYRAYLRDEIALRGITRFKYLLNTHFHEDHISGLYWLMRYGFEADEYLTPYTDYAMSLSERQRETIRQAERSGIPVRQVFHGDTLLLGEAVLTLYRRADGATTNARSLVTRVAFGDASLLLCADIIGETQLWMVDTLPPEALRADIVKAPHHGVTPMNLSFLEAVSPQAVLFTSEYDRVDKARIQLEARGIPAYYSGEGTVVFETDGEDWYIYQLTDGSD